MPNGKIDDLDRAILSLLVKDARTPFLEIARHCGVSGAAIHQRVKKLEDSGVISGSRIIVKPNTIGLDVCAYVGVNLVEDSRYPEVVAALKKIPEIVECHFVTGSAGILVKIYCFDNSHLMDVILNRIQLIPGVKSTETTITLDTAFERQIWVKATKENRKAD